MGEMREREGGRERGRERGRKGEKKGGKEEEEAILLDK